MEIYNNEQDQRLFDMLYDNPEMIIYLKNRYQTDRIWKFCIDRESTLFGQMENPSIEMCEFALDVDGENIISLVTKFTDVKLTKRMIWIALRTFPGAILHVPRYMLDEDMLNASFDAQPELLTAFPNLSYEYLLRRIKDHPGDIVWLENPRDELVHLALEKNPYLCVHFTSLTPHMINIIRAQNPGLADMYMNTLESEIDDYAENSEEEGPTVDQWSDPHQLRCDDVECAY